MTRGERLQPVADVAHREADQAAEEAARVRARLERERQRLRELTQYRDEYARGSASAGQSMHAGALQGARAFAAQLNQAVVEQEEGVRAVAAEFARAEEQWREKRSRAQAMDHVIDGYQADERRRTERREQLASDEHAARQRGKPV